MGGGGANETRKQFWAVEGFSALLLIYAMPGSVNAARLISLNFAFLYIYLAKRMR